MKDVAKCESCKKQPCDKHTEVNGICIDYEEQDLSEQEVNLLKLTLQAGSIDCDYKKVNSVNVMLSKKQIKYLLANGFPEKLSK